MSMRTFLLVDATPEDRARMMARMQGQIRRDQQIAALVVLIAFTAGFTLGLYGNELATYAAQTAGW